MDGEEQRAQAWHAVQPEPAHVGTNAVRKAIERGVSVTLL